MKKMSLEQMATVEGGKFWVTGRVQKKLINGCTKHCQQDYMFWFKVGDIYGCTDWSCGPMF
jgi:hypothetical protein